MISIRLGKRASAEIGGTGRNSLLYQQGAALHEAQAKVRVQEKADQYEKPISDRAHLLLALRG